MPDDHEQPRRWSTLSHAHEAPELRRDNPLYERAGSVRAAFDAERAPRRESFMVKRQHPRPVLRPGPALAREPERTAFDAQWREEYNQARQFNAAHGHLNIQSERNTTMDDTNSNNSPRDVLRDGNLKASIWRNEGEKGPFYSVNLARVYRDEHGELRDSHSFAGADLLRVSELARRTYERAQELRRTDRPAGRENDRPSDAPLLEHDNRAARRDRFDGERAQPRSAAQQPDRTR